MATLDSGPTRVQNPAPAATRVVGGAKARERDWQGQGGSAEARARPCPKFRFAISHVPRPVRDYGAFLVPGAAALQSFGEARRMSVVWSHSWTPLPLLLGISPGLPRRTQEARGGILGK